MTEKKMLVVLAHPDDESFGMGGTLAYYASQGVEIHLVCATKGEAGDVADEYMQGYDSVAAVREAELRCAVEMLGLSALHFLNYRDSGMAGTKANKHADALAGKPLDEVAEKVVRHIRELQPQVVVTFDPVGGYHHPDHIAIHRATVRAFHAAGDASEFQGTGSPFQPEKLYYSVFSRRSLRIAIRLLRLFGRNPRKFGRNQDIDLVELAGDEDYPEHAIIDYKGFVAQKEAADACHASQLDPNPSFLSRMFRRVRGFGSGKDTFMRAYPPAPDGFRTTDLFAG
jgi:N-acetyl-1-D-myo-inositol-2-amino-2-deoxy-alpha-D-glucopyranoside deacetylase/mycothiol S-conjugate amidase